MKTATVSAVDEFQREMERHGLACPDAIIGDGKIHRYHVDGDSNDSRNGYYLLHDDEYPCGICGSWKSGERFSWSAKGEDNLSRAERERHKIRMEAAKAASERERKRLNEEAAIRARAIWEKSQPATEDHPYLQKKQVQAHGARIHEGSIVIPAYGPGGEIATIQFISEDGTKKFLRDGAKRGNYFTIGKPGDLIYLCEGFATGATLHEITGVCVVVAFDAWNLKPVAERIKAEYPECSIIVCADNDVATPGNPGLTKAKEAAAAVGGDMVYPVFENISGNGKPFSDFNDLYVSEGREAVQAQLQPKEVQPETGTISAWPDPIPLESQAAPELPKGLFPEWLDEMVEAVARATETPRELAAALGLASVAAACQRAFEVEPEPGYIEPLNLYIVAAMDSGNRKSAVLTAMTEPLSTYEREQALLIAPKRKEAESQLKTAEARIHHLRLQAAKAEDSVTFDTLSQEVAKLEAEPPKVPTVPQFWVEDVTPEKLAQVMDEQGGTLSLISDEGGIFETFAGRYNGGIPNLDLILKSHSGSPVRIHRACREAIDMESPTLTIGLSPQPEILRGLVQKPGFRGCGLLARFLYVIPTSRLGFRSLESNPVAPSVKEAYGFALRSLLTIKSPIREDGNPSRYRIRFTPKARQEWKEFSRAIEQGMRDGEKFQYMRDWAGKLPGAAARVAALLHCAEHAKGKPWEHQVSLETMEWALDLMGILAEHAIQAFEMMAVNPDVETAKKVLNWLKRKPGASFTLRECHRDLHGTFRRVEDLKPGVDVLVERGFIRQATGQEKRPGRPSLAFDVNPIFTQEGANNGVA